MGGVVDATFRRYLEPPDFQPAMGFLRQGMVAEEELKIGNFSLPEDEQLLRVGVVLEVGTELMRVVAYDQATRTASIRRGQLGTLIAIHFEGDPVKISPTFPRMDVIEAVGSYIPLLTPPLFTVNVIHASQVFPQVAILDDELAVSIIDVRCEGQMFSGQQYTQLVEHHPQTGTRAVILPQIDGDVWIRYRRRTVAPSGDQGEHTLLTELGMEPVWAPAVMAGAAGEMMMGRDIPRTQTEWVGQVLESQGVSVGKRQELAIGLLNYRELLIEEFKREQTQQYRSVTSIREDPLASLYP